MPLKRTRIRTANDRESSAAVLPPKAAQKGMRQGQGREQAEGIHRLKRLRRIRRGIERISPVPGARFARSDRPRPSTDRLSRADVGSLPKCALGRRQGGCSKKILPPGRWEKNEASFPLAVFGRTVEADRSRALNRRRPKAQGESCAKRENRCGKNAPLFVFRRSVKPYMAQIDSSAAFGRSICQGFAIADGLNC